ncbi:peroxisome proliferator-activated receptor gamma coactivator 1-alpha-like [Amblyraja radiata]|uniref:peroxisome proliferator-activated receptor gamma coactivator 1-alpha-like n=1 Tax=Amblyraja radiata TaxID=386614 RepID=UPI001402860E|nr:peroxisome proliferator-activated receptor gamma coactivator 1-alpha-like [Amblyraja radiata]
MAGCGLNEDLFFSSSSSSSSFLFSYIKESPFTQQCAALVGEDQPLCSDLPELDLSELDVNDLDTENFLGGLKWYSDQSEIISNQYGSDSSDLFEKSAECTLHLK